MKRSKVFMVILAVVIIAFGMCFTGNVYAEDTANSDETPVITEDMLRTGENSETNEDNGIMPISEDGTEVDTGTTTGDTDTDTDTDTTGEEADEHIPEEKDEDLFISSPDADYELTDMVIGNVYIFAKNVTINAEYIDGDVFIFGSESVTIAENTFIQSNLFVYSPKIKMEGMAYNAYFLATDSVIFGDNAYIGRDLKVYADTLYHTGRVGRNINAYVNTLTFPVDPVVQPEPAEEGEEQEEPTNKVNIGGNIYYTASKEAENIDKINLMGEKYYTAKADITGGSTGALAYAVDAIGAVLFDVIMFLLIGFLAPKFVEKTKSYVSSRGIIATLVGIVAAFVAFLVAVTFIFAQVGAYLGIALLFITVSVCLLGGFASVIAISGFVSDKLNVSENNVKKTLVVAGVSLVIWGLKQIPYVGIAVSLITFFCGVGIIVLYQFDKRKEIAE